MVAVPGWRARLPTLSLQALIAAEATTRANADTDLQTQIDALVPGGGLSGVLAGLDVLDIADQQLIKATGAATFEAIDLDVFSEPLLALADAAAWRSALGIGASNDISQWRTRDNLALQAAIGARNFSNLTTVGKPVKVAFITDSLWDSCVPGKFFTNEFCARHLGVGQFFSSHNWGGSNSSQDLWPWTLGGGATALAGVGPSGKAVQLTAGQTVTEQLSDAITVDAGDRVWDRCRLHFRPSAATVNVVIDGNAVATGLGMAATTISVTTTAGSKNLTSSAVFTSAMRGRACSGAGIPRDTDLDTFTNTSLMVMSREATASATITLTLLPTWTSALLTQKDHTIVVTGVSGAAELQYIYHYHGNRTQGSQVHHFSRAGWKTQDFYALSSLSAPVPTLLNHVTVASTDLQDVLAREDFTVVVFCTATNDPDLATYASTMQSLVTATRASLPNATFALWVPEPKNDHTWMTGLSAQATTLAEANDMLLVDMNDVMYDHSGTHGTNIDQPYELTVDGTHYNNRGSELVARMLLEVLDGGANANAIRSWDVSSSGGRVAIYTEGLQGGFAVYPTAGQYGTPALYLGIGPFTPGLFGLDGNGNIDTSIIRSAAGVWTMSNWSVDAGGVGTIKTFSDTGIGAGGVGFAQTGDVYPRAWAGVDGAFGGGIFFSDGTTDIADAMVRRTGAAALNVATAGVGDTTVAGVAAPTAASMATPRSYIDQFQVPRVDWMSVLSQTVTFTSTGGGRLTNAGTQTAFTPDNTAAVVGERVLLWQVFESLTITTNGTTTVTSAGLFKPGHAGPISGSGIPASTTLTYVDANTATLSNAATNSTTAARTLTAQHLTGFYTVNTVGTGATNWVLDRTTGYTTAASYLRGMKVFVTGGAVNRGVEMHLDSAAPTTINSEAMTWHSAHLGHYQVRGGNNLSFPALNFYDAADVIQAQITMFSNGVLSMPAISPSGDVTMANAKNIVVNTSTGTKIATATGQRLGFWNATPIIQPASANQAAVGTTAPAGGTGAAAGAWSSAANRDTAIATINSCVTLVNQIRTDLVAAGILKGSA